ncbi:hypothetical protein J3459_007826 [Metarhizium acridum]|uniref:Uncharacterized protein n=1 Tax=Metarhizium acridum (strain CQMa 102) TaxID=655827 RepID=E9EF82_METAQ|nr:uncharacterized protein MAC_08530 [Metarhizium acridum CQMa 102]EFY85398.1 hypothetical protein MAC_08530 [Metarhizium acridum CQMa 102]KAG8416369.1 hypothetical protein J3458_006961 [Metarhizium acridum]KAG8426781.1 hypothetical protein J3459_007826 [Metarhizium acridum]
MSDKKSQSLVPVIVGVAKFAAGVYADVKKTKNGDKASQQTSNMSSKDMKEAIPAVVDAINQFADAKTNNGDKTTKQTSTKSSDHMTEFISSLAAAATTLSSTGAEDGDKTTERSGSRPKTEMVKKSIKFGARVAGIWAAQQSNASQEASKKAK